MRGAKLLIGIAIVGTVGYVAWAKTRRTPDKRACARLSELCASASADEDSDDKADKDDACDQFFSALRRNAPESADHTIACVNESRSCGQAAGCVSGGAIHIGTGFVRDFAEGLNQSLRR